MSIIDGNDLDDLRDKAARVPQLEAEIMWLRSSLVSLLVLAEAKPSPLTNEQVATICRVTLSKRPGDG